VIFGHIFKVVVVLLVMMMMVHVVMTDQITATVHLLVHQHGLNTVVSQTRLQVIRVQLLLGVVDEVVDKVGLVVVDEAAAVAAGVVVAALELVPLVVQATSRVHEEVADCRRLEAQLS